MLGRHHQHNCDYNIKHDVLRRRAKTNAQCVAQKLNVLLKLKYSKLLAQLCRSYLHVHVPAERKVLTPVYNRHFTSN